MCHFPCTFEAVQNTIDHIAAACIAEGISEAVICPGSRNAPLVIAFKRSTKINCLSVPDERSAGFIALGKAIASKKPVILCCTSGSAVVNFYPAIVEAYYQQVPLLVITADRPHELIDQWDGQTIRQKNIFLNHVRGFWETPDNYSNGKEFAKLVQEAIACSMSGIKGPVHVNVPLREPFYPSPNHHFTAQVDSLKGIEENPIQACFDVKVISEKKVLVIRGMRQETCDPIPSGMAIYADVLSSVPGEEPSVSELIFMTKDEELLQKYRPEVLISDGTAILSKTVKQYLRKYPPQWHYHFSEKGDIADPFGTNPLLVRSNLDKLLADIKSCSNKRYSETLLNDSTACRNAFSELFQEDNWNEFKAIYRSIQLIPKNAVLHAANSMSVRYVAFCEPQLLGLQVKANRGTSGIDGCVSTALGFQSIHKGLNYLFVGDIAFFYDSNAFWNSLKELPLKVILMNNGGGGIFRLIDGPAQQPELESFFETVHARNAADLCANLGVAYSAASNLAELEAGLNFLNNNKASAVLEVFTVAESNQSFFKQFKSLFHGV
jgi:2-succinyl-5-enolpyruvyl-6-hydroxy-3-cyclohexene-1-carboxylate synthase